MNKTKEAILKTLVYADIFDYPLTSKELSRFLINTELVSSRTLFGIRQIEPMLKQVQHDKKIGTDGKYFFLKGRKEIVALRKKREKWSREKLKIAAKAASFLKFIPWIKMAGITGALAMKNTDKDDDIDILIVSAKNRIWLTRFLATILMELLKVRRRPLASKIDRTKYHDRVILSTKTFKDKICLNMYLDEAHLEVPIKEQDLFTAHEVVQVKPLWEKDQTYQKFLGENLWVKKYLPNAIKRKEKIEKSKKTNKKEKIFLPFLILICHFSLFIFNFSFWEKLFKQFQLWYMRKRRTTEVISDGVIRFHPQDARKWVLTRYQDSLKIALIKKE